MFDSLAAGTSFTQMLMDQARETDLVEEQRDIAELIVGNIDDYGYLKATVEEMSASTGLPPEKITEVLKVIQTFDPPGVGASDLRDRQMLQLDAPAGKRRSNIALCAISWTRWANGASRKLRGPRAAPLTRRRRRWAASRVWNRDRGAPF